MHTAPNNEAVAELLRTYPEGTLTITVGELQDILLYHVVAGAYPSSSLTSGDIEALNGDSISVAVTDAKIDVNHIPYKGSSEALTDIVGGRVDAYFAPISSVLELVKGGKVRAIAVSTSKRSSLLPNVPTIAESGLPGFEYSLWFGLWGPAGIPPAIVEKIANDVKRASVDARGKLQAIGNEPLEMTQLQFTAYVNNEIKNSAVLLKAAGIEPQ